MTIQALWLKTPTDVRHWDIQRAVFLDGLTGAKAIGLAKTTQAGSWISEHGTNFQMEESMARGVTGSRHYRWCSGIGRHKDGYIKIRVGKEHPIADRNGWCYLHQLVWWAAGRLVPHGHILHHKNEDKADCRISNLEVITRAEHNRHHNKQKQIDPLSGRFVGKKAAGRLLDGREWSQFPGAAA